MPADDQTRYDGIPWLQRPGLGRRPEVRPPRPQPRPPTVDAPPVRQLVSSVRGSIARIVACWPASFFATSAVPVHEAIRKSNLNTVGMILASLPAACEVIALSDRADQATEFLEQWRPGLNNHVIATSLQPSTWIQDPYCAVQTPATELVEPAKFKSQQDAAMPDLLAGCHEDGWYCTFDVSCDGSAGQSGSAFYSYNTPLGNTPVALGVYSAAECSGPACVGNHYPNGVTRITPDVAAMLAYWKSQWGG